MITRELRQLPEPFNLSETEKAYWAGFFDADASVGIDHTGYGGKNFSPRFHCALQLADIAQVEKMSEIFDSAIINRKDGCIGVRSSGDKAIKIINTVVPYLRIKETEARVVLVWYQRYPTEESKSKFSEDCHEVLISLRQAERDLPSFEQPLSEEWKAYLAGYVEGDGSITIPAPDGRYFVVRVQVGAHSSVVKQLYSIKELYGGTVSLNRYAHYSLSGEKAVNLLQDISPYLILKERQAALALEFHQVRKSTPNHRDGKKKSIGEVYHSLVSDLNQRKSTTNIKPVLS